MLQSVDICVKSVGGGGGSCIDLLVSANVYKSMGIHV
jgi:hypothetical protein